jgi:hypothetical protein
MDFTLISVTVMALLVATAIVIYSWNKFRLLSYTMAAWFVLAVGLAQIPYFEVAGSWQPGDLQGFAIFSNLLSVPLIILLVAWKKSTAFRNFLDATPTWILVSTQVYRLVGLVFLIYYLQGKLAFEVGFTSGIMDVLTAISAIIVAWLVYHKPAREKTLVLAWCIFGLVDFASAFTITGLSLFGIIQLVPEPSDLGMPPLTIISIFQVPLAIFIHIYLIARVRKLAK